MKILVTGSSGSIGSALVPALRSANHSVSKLVRREPGAADEIRWDPSSGVVALGELEGFDSVVHLAGESLAAGRWDESRKTLLRESRVRGTSFLSESLARLERPPRALVSASAIGYYGDRGDEILDEDSAPGHGFLPSVAREWESATEPAARHGIRVVRVRTGIVLSKDGGALAKMLVPFRLGLGGPLADGRAWWSWIGLEDLIAIYRFAIESETLQGAVNAVAPAPVRNLEFTRTLGRVLGRPTVFRVPAFALRLAFGEMADAALLASARVSPRRLTDVGYRFVAATLESALRAELLAGSSAPSY